MELQLSRPLVILDLETTGLDVARDYIVQFAAVKCHPDGRREELARLVRPPSPIPPEATAIHGITDAMVADQPSFAEQATAFLDLLADADLAGYNLWYFDLPLLANEFKRCSVDFDFEAHHIIDVYHIFRRMEPRDLSAALRFYCGEEHSAAHDAAGDVAATFRVLEGQLRRYGDLPRDPAGLAARFNPRNPAFVDRNGRFRWQQGEVVIGFGRWRGSRLRDLAAEHPDYLQWILRGDFDDEVKGVAEGALDGHFPAPPAATEKI